MVKGICPVCDHEFEITKGMISIAMNHRHETGSVVLVADPWNGDRDNPEGCCRALIIPSPDDKNGTVSPEEYYVQLGGDSDDYLDCIPLLEDQIAKEPDGMIDYQGEKVYRPGDGSAPLRRWDYMFKFGIDPACMWYRMHDPEKPFVVGGH